MDEHKVKEAVNSLNDFKETPLYVTVANTDNVKLVEFLVKRYFLYM